MDEATASIDIKTEEAIHKAITSLMIQSTVITIAHRIKTIMNYDKILVLDQGKKVEFDTPRTLMSRQSSIFKSMMVKSNLNYENL